MPKKKKNEMIFSARARKTGTKKFEALGESTSSFSEAAKRMWDAFNDDEVYDRTEVIMIKDGDETPKYTVTKKRPI